jgi:hypothetical protein
MPQYPPGFFLNPHNWTFLPQRPMLPAYPWTPSEESVRWSTIDRGDPQAPGNIVRGLLDFPGPGTTGTGILDIAPAEPNWGGHRAFSEDPAYAAPQYAPLSIPFDSHAEHDSANIPQALLGGAVPLRSLSTAWPPEGAGHPVATADVLSPGRAPALQQAFGPRDPLGMAPQAGPLNIPFFDTESRGSNGNENYASNAVNGGYGHEQPAPGSADGDYDRAYAQAASQPMYDLSGENYTMKQDSSPQALDTTLNAIQLLSERDRRRVVPGNAATTAIQTGTFTETPDGNIIVSNGSVVSLTTMEDKPTTMVATARGSTTILINRKTGVFTFQNPR